MVYQLSCEEHKYLAGIRREKESFERLIKERGVRTVNFLPRSVDGTHLYVSQCYYQLWSKELPLKAQVMPLSKRSARE